MSRVGKAINYGREVHRERDREEELPLFINLLL